MKKIRIILVILLILLIILIVVLVRKNNKKLGIGEKGPLYEPDTTITKTTNKSFYFVVNECISKYFNYIADNKTNEIYNILDSEYIKQNNITKTNVESKLNKFNKEQTFTIKEIYQVNGVEYFKFYTHIEILGNNQDKIELYLGVNIDFSNCTFNIKPILETDFESAVKNGVEKEEEKTISANNDNLFEYKTISQQKMAEIYFEDYKKYMLYDSEYAYQLLDIEYKEARFSDINKYQKYIQNNSKQIINSKISEYKVEEKEDYTEYIIIDNYNNYYTIKEKSVMNYTIELDNYTIKTPEFIDKYNSSNVEDRVITDIGIFIRMINAKDYENAYAVLSEGFKNNYFKTEKDFENYAKQNFFDYNILSLNNFDNEGDIYMYDMTLKESVSTVANKIEKKVILKLGEGTNFQISFNVE